MSTRTENVIVDLDKFMTPRQPGVARPVDPLDEILQHEDQQLARDVKRTHAKRVLTEESIRLKELEAKLLPEEEKVAKQVEGPEVDPKVFQMIAGMPEEQQEKALQVYTTMVAARGAKGEAAFMPLILGTMNARPNSSATDLITAVTKIVDLVENVRTPPASNGNDKAVDALVTLATQPKTGTAGETAQLITAIAQVVREGQPQAPAADPVATAIGMIRDLKDLGLMGNQQPVQTGIQDETRIRLEEIRRDTDIKLAELGLKKDVETRKLDNDEKRTNAIGGVIERAAKVAGRAFGEGENQAAGQTATMAAPSLQLTTTKCPSCQKEIQIPNPSQPRQLECPHCKSILAWDGKA